MTEKKGKAKKRRTHPSAMPKGVEQLCWLAQGLSRSGSRAEDQWWERQLVQSVRTLFDEGDDQPVQLALEHLFRSDDSAYGELLDVVESEAEMVQVGEKVLLLVAAPVLAWSRYSVPVKTIPPAVLEQLRTLLSSHIFAPGVHFALADYLFSPDQLPDSYLATRRFLLGMAGTAAGNGTFAIDGQQLPQTMNFLSDIRYLLIAALVHPDEPIFRWHIPGCQRDQAYADWRKRVLPIFERLLIGCGIEIDQPDALFTASRKASQYARLFAIFAAIAYLATEFDIGAGQLRAVIAPCEGSGDFEFRIGLCLKPTERVVHGLSWPLLASNETEEEAIDEILKTLRESGVTDTLVLRRTLPLEFCEDCGAPLFPNPKGELEHVQSPDDETGDDEPLGHGKNPPRYLH
jgi:hypothetical protein